MPTSSRRLSSVTRPGIRSRYVYGAGAGLFNILARDYGPWQHRGAAYLARVKGLGEYLEAGIGALTGLPGRPVSLLHTETALAQLERDRRPRRPGRGRVRTKSGRGQRHRRGTRHRRRDAERVDRRTRHHRRVPPPAPRRGGAARRWRGPAGARALPAQAPPHPGDRPSLRGAGGARAARLRRGPRRDAAARPGSVAAVAAGPADAINGCRRQREPATRRSSEFSTRSAGSTDSRMSCSIRRAMRSAELRISAVPTT